MPTSDVLSPADVAEFRALLADLAFPDLYELRRPVATGTDDYGNTETGETLIESGLGRLRTGGLQPTEREMAGRLGWTGPYVVDLPYATLAVATDTLRIATRDFEIQGVLREGAWGIQATAVCQERG
jgi:hypothetical protein